MSRIASVCWIFLSLAYSDAARIQSHVEGGHDANDKNPFTPTCETLHTRFLARANNLQAFVSSYTESDAMGAVARARSVMKATAVLRTLRRGSDCPWAVDGNSDDLEAIGKTVRTAIGSNPCAPTAIRELHLVDIPVGDDSHAPLAKAMCILMSDTCECETEGQEPVEVDGGDVDHVETEEAVQDMVEDMIESEDAPSSLVENSKIQSRFSWKHASKLIGAIMLGVLFTVGCGFAGFQIVGVVAAIFVLLLLVLANWVALGVAAVGSALGSTVVSAGAMYTVFISGGLGAASAAMTCGTQFYQLVNSTGFLLYQ